MNVFQIITDPENFSPRDTIKLCENVHEATRVAERLLRSGQITVNDSRDLFWESLEIARKFEAQFDAETGDYLADIEQYAEEVLRKAFPPDPCKNENIFFRLPDGTVIQAQLCGDAATPEAGNGWASIETIVHIADALGVCLCVLIPLHHANGQAGEYKLLVNDICKLIQTRTGGHCSHD